MKVLYTIVALICVLNPLYSSAESPDSSDQQLAMSVPYVLVDGKRIVSLPKGVSHFDPALRQTITTISNISVINPDEPMVYYKTKAGLKPITELYKLSFYEVVEGLLGQDISKPDQKELDNLYLYMISPPEGCSGLDNLIGRLIERKQSKSNASPEAKIFYTIMAAIQKSMAGRYNQARGVIKFDGKSFGDDFLAIICPKGVPAHFGRLLESMLVLHMDHELNASTNAVRQVASTDADLTSAIIAGLCALSGPKHGGASEAVLEMLDKIKDFDAFRTAVRSKEAKIMGVGHAIYKKTDPRAEIMRSLLEANIAHLNINLQHYKLLKQIEHFVLSDEYFTSRGLAPNVDFYSGILYEGMGFKRNQITPLFALARVIGWMAHYNEQRQPPNQLMRPSAITLDTHQKLQKAQRSKEEKKE